jgi:hypothetical protein
MTYTINELSFHVKLSDNGYYLDTITGRYIHRIIAEKKFGRRLKKFEVVHHIDGNKLNNDPRNLFVCYWEFHDQIHEDEVTKENFWNYVNEKRYLNVFYRKIK